MIYSKWESFVRGQMSWLKHPWFHKAPVLFSPFLMNWIAGLLRCLLFHVRESAVFHAQSKIFFLHTFMQFRLCCSSSKLALFVLDWVCGLTSCFFTLHWTHCSLSGLWVVTHPPLLSAPFSTSIYMSICVVTGCMLPLFAFAMGFISQSGLMNL